MTEADIAEMFIRAAETERKLPQVRGMQVDFGRYTLPWVHELTDIGDRRRTNDVRTENLRDKDDPLAEWRWKWLNEDDKRSNSAEVSQWYACLRITSEFLTDAGQRRALWAWAMAQANNLWFSRPGASPRKISFARWCRDEESVAEITGHRRKNRALASIEAAYHGKPHLHWQNAGEGVLPDTHEIEHVFATVEGQHAVYDTKRVLVWQADPSFKTTGLTMREWRNARRREAQRRKREKVAA